MPCYLYLDREGRAKTDRPHQHHPIRVTIAPNRRPAAKHNPAANLRFTKRSRCQSGDPMNRPDRPTLEMPLKPQPNCQRSTRSDVRCGVVPSCQIDRGHTPSARCSGERDRKRAPGRFGPTGAAPYHEPVSLSKPPSVVKAQTGLRVRVFPRGCPSPERRAKGKAKGVNPAAKELYRTGGYFQATGNGKTPRGHGYRDRGDPVRPSASRTGVRAPAHPFYGNGSH